MLTPRLMELLRRRAKRKIKFVDFGLVSAVREVDEYEKEGYDYQVICKHVVDRAYASQDAEFARGHLVIARLVRLLSRKQLS